jgi:hypothetical protein
MRRHLNGLQSHQTEQEAAAAGAMLSITTAAKLRAGGKAV